MTGKFLIIALAGALAVGSGGAAFAAQTATQTATNWRSPDLQGMRATRALNLLEVKGDGQFSNFSPSGRDFKADVTKGGQIMHVLIKPQTGQIEQIGRAT